MRVRRADAQKSGVTPESVKAAAKASGMTLEEAQKILGVDRSASLQEVLKVSTLLRCTLHCSVLTVVSGVPGL